MISFTVHLTEDAAHDLNSPGRADHVLEQIEKALGRLSEYPERGNYPIELLDVGVREYREISFG